MTQRQVAFAVARFWGLLPHVLWNFPFRYYVELRSFCFSQLGSSPEPFARSVKMLDWEANSFEGEAI
jgi:hypothetical protein